MNIVNSFKENFSNPTDKWNSMSTGQKISMILSILVGIILITLVGLKRFSDKNYLSLVISTLTPDVFIGLIGVIYVILGGLNWS